MDLSSLVNLLKDYMPFVGFLEALLVILILAVFFRRAKIRLRDYPILLWTFSIGAKGSLAPYISSSIGGCNFDRHLKITNTGALIYFHINNPSDKSMKSPRVDFVSTDGFDLSKVLSEHSNPDEKFGRRLVNGKTHFVFEGSDKTVIPPKSSHHFAGYSWNFSDMPDVISIPYQISVQDQLFNGQIKINKWEVFAECQERTKSETPLIPPK